MDEGRPAARFQGVKGFRWNGREVVQEGNYLIVARQRRDAGWEITRMIWNNRTLP